MEITTVTVDKTNETFIEQVNDFIDAIDVLIVDNKKIFTTKQKKAYNGYKAIFKKTKTTSASLVKLIDGFKRFFSNFDYLLFSESPLTINTQIYYDSSKTDYYIPLEAILENFSESAETVRDFLIRLSQTLEESAEKKESKRKFILSRSIFGLKIDDSTPEGEFICKWIVKAREILPFNELMSVKDPQGLLPIVMSLVTSNKINQYTVEIKDDWISKGLSLPSLMRKMADVIEEMGLNMNPPREISLLPPLLRGTSDDIDRFEEVEEKKQD